MPHFAIFCPDLAGHLVPAGSLGAALTQRGHQVTLVAGSKAAAMAEEMGLRHHLLETSDVPWGGIWSWLTWKLFAAVGASPIISIRNDFLWYSQVMFRKVLPVLKELAVDGLLVDHMPLAGSTVAEHLGLPFVTVWSATPFLEDPLVPPGSTGWSYRADRRAVLRNRLGYAGWRWFIAPTLRLINRYRRTWNLPPLARIDDAYSRLAQLSQWFPGFDFPRSRIPDCFHYVGWLGAGRPIGHHVRAAEQAFPWERLDGRPLIYASMGTIDDPQNRPIYAKIAAACVGLNAQLVIERRKADDTVETPEPPEELPGNPLIVDSVPPLVLLERAALMITHGGTNTIFECISRGVPMVALPRGADQPGNAARMAYAGAGLVSPFRGGRPEDLRKVIERVLTDPQFRQRTQELNVAMRAAGGAPRAAEIVEQAVATGRPVLRQ